MSRMICAWVAELARKLDEKDGVVMFAEADVDSAIEAVRLETPQDRQAIAEDLLALSAKLMRTKNAKVAIEQLCEVAASALADRTEGTELVREKIDLSKWTGGQETMRAPVYSARPRPTAAPTAARRNFSVR